MILAQEVNSSDALPTLVAYSYFSGRVGRVTLPCRRRDAIERHNLGSVTCRADQFADQTHDPEVGVFDDQAGGMHEQVEHGAILNRPLDSQSCRFQERIE